jgi:hypothetical protein
MTNATTAAEARRIAAVSDPTWSPPPAPEDLTGLPRAAFDWDRDWPAWVTSVQGFETGSRWRLTQAAHVVLPQQCLCPTLALREESGPPSRYEVEAGTTLTLVKVYDPEADETVRELDVANYYAYVEGWATRTYRIETGRSAGVLVGFSADRRGNRFPFSSRLAHAAIVPEDGLTNRP